RTMLCRFRRSGFLSSTPPCLAGQRPAKQQQSESKRTSERLILGVHGAGLLRCELKNPEQLHRTVNGGLISRVICSWIAGIGGTARILGESFKAIGHIGLTDLLEH